jgi:uncharacterized MAPEG superfamily protein
MNHTLSLVVYSAILTWAMLYAAAIIRTRAWTPVGLKTALGNRDDLVSISPLAFRADQTAQNTLEGFVLFAALALTVQSAGVITDRTELGANLFFWARIAYIPIYLIGIAYLRTAIWIVSIIGLGIMVASLFS